MGSWLPGKTEPKKSKESEIKIKLENHLDWKSKLKSAIIPWISKLYYLYLAWKSKFKWKGIYFQT